MLVILGTKSKRKVEAVGQFVCPRCKEKQDYEVKSVRQWFTLFFIAIFPIEKKKEYFVECKACQRSYYTDVLENNNYYSDGTSVIGATKSTNELESETHTIRECPDCGTKLRLPKGKSGTVKCILCGEKFETST